MRKFFVVSVLLGLMLQSTAWAQSTVDPVIRDVDLTGFPSLSLIISVPESVTPNDIEVMENGSLVEATIEPLLDSGHDVDVVLLVDTSGSMIGEPIASAIQAATDFVEQLPDAVTVGLVTFGDSTHIQSGLTDKKSSVTRGLGALQAQGETALYDGVVAASSVFAGDAQRNIVLLSDGGDTVSQANFAQALKAAKSRDVSVYSVGLETEESDNAALQRLSTKTGGRFSTAATAELSEIYSDLASEIEGQYVVSYTSDTPPGEDLAVSISSPAGEVSRILVAPAADPVVETEPPRPVPVEAPDPLIGGAEGLLFALAVAFAAVFVIAFLVVQGQARTRRDRTLMARFSPAPETKEVSDASTGVGGRVPRPLVELGTRLSSILGRDSSLEAQLEAANVSVTAGELLGAAAGLSIVGFALGVLLFGGNLIFALIGAFVLGAIPFALLSRARRTRLLKVQSQLPEVLAVLASSLRAGYSFVQALDTASQEIAQPAAHEFSRVIAEIRLGRPVDEAMNAMADRIGSEDFRWAVLAVNIQRTVGGNLAEVLDTVAETIREREEIRRLISTLSAEGRLSIRILTVMPLLLATYMAKVNPDYISLLFETNTGLMMISIAGALLVVGLLWMRKLVRIDV